MDTEELFTTPGQKCFIAAIIGCTYLACNKWVLPLSENATITSSTLYLGCAEIKTQTNHRESIPQPLALHYRSANTFLNITGKSSIVGLVLNLRSPRGAFHVLHQKLKLSITIRELSANTCTSWKSPMVDQLCMDAVSIALMVRISLSVPLWLVMSHGYEFCYSRY